MKIAGKISGWIVEADESLDEVKSIGYISEIRRFEGIISSLTRAREALMDRNIPEATTALEGLLA